MNVMQIFRELHSTIKKGVLPSIMRANMRIRRKVVEILRSEEYQLVKPNIKYKNIHKGQRCFILGNGPSLKKVDFASLKDEITFTVNQCPRMEDFAKLHTKYHIWVDEVFFNEDFSTPEGKELLAVMRAVNTPDNHPIVFYKTSARKMIIENHLDDDLNISYLMEGFKFKDPNLDLPIDRPVSMFDTCIHYLILTAVYMGFSEIYLLGCDCTGILTNIYARMNAAEKMEYAYDCGANEIKRLKKQQQLRPFENDLLCQYFIFRAYRLLDLYCKNHGVKLFNATKGSLLQDIETVRLEDVLKRKAKEM